MDIPEIKYKATIVRKWCFWICIIQKAYQSTDYYAANEKNCKAHESLPVFVTLTKRGLYKKVRKWRDTNEPSED